jgi:predicted dehydrogenase
MFHWGIIGSGFAARKFVHGLRQSQEGAPALVYSRTRAHAESFARDFNIPKVASSLDEAMQSKVDAFYIATPPTSHKAQALACFSAGKPVLIEKPFAVSLADADAIVVAARASRVFCMEGMWTLHLPILAQLRQVLASGAIGSPRSLCGSFGISNLPDASDNQFNPDLGGGALFHRGVYPMSLAIALLGPAQIAGGAATLNEKAVEEDCVVILKHDAGAISTLRASLRAPLSNDLTIEGTHGVLHVEAPVFRPFRFTVRPVVPARRGGGGGKASEALRESHWAQSLQQRARPLAAIWSDRSIQRRFCPYSGNGYHYQADEAARCIRAGLVESEASPLATTLLTSALIDQARRIWSPPPGLI